MMRVRLPFRRPRSDDAGIPDRASPYPLAEDPLAPRVAEAAAGDNRARATVIHAVSPAVVAVTRALLGRDHPDFDDVAQESLLCVNAAIDRFRGDSSFLHYARRIAVRTALAARRRAGRTPTATDDVVLAEEAGAPGHFDRERRIAAFRGLLDELPEAQSESLALRIVLGYSLEQVADATGVPVNTVRSRIRLAKEALRQRITSSPTLLELFDVAEGNREVGS